MAAAAERPCPICGKAAGARPGNPFGPFCSERCRLADLGSWLNGAYRIAGDPVDGEDQESRGAETETEREAETEADTKS